MFDNPEEVIIDREHNRHIAFVWYTSLRDQPCSHGNAGSDCLKMIPEFELTDADAVTWAGGQVRGPRNIPVTFPTSPLIPTHVLHVASQHVPELEFVAHVNVELGEPLELGSVLIGQRRVIPITGGSISGPLLNAEILDGGADWQIVSADGTA